jgi:HK97 gp10 family phage protein
MTDGVHVKIDGIQSLVAKLSRLESEISNDLEHAATQGAFVFEKAAKENVSGRGGLRVRTGHFRDSIGTKTAEKTSTRVVVAVTVNHPGAKIHEFGGVIKAKNKPYLVFTTEDGEWHTVKSVTMPARPYLRPAFDSEKGTVRDTIAADLRTSIRRVTALGRFV